MAHFSDAGMALLKQFEQCKLQAYDDATDEAIDVGDEVHGTLTIGWGHTGPDVVPGLTWTQGQADRQLVIDLAPTCSAIGSAVKVSLSDNQFSAFVTFAFNIGVTAFNNSSALRCANSGQFGQVPGCISLFDKTRINGQLVTSKGLISRRAAEVALWQLPDGTAIPDFKTIGDAATSGD